MESYRVLYCRLNEDISGKKRKLQCVITFQCSYKINGNNIEGEWETIEDSQRTYKETLRGVRASTVAEDKQYPARVFVNVDVQHATSPLLVVIYGLLGFTVFFFFHVTS